MATADEDSTAAATATVAVNGRSVPVDSTTTGLDLKQAVEAGADSMLTYCAGTCIRRLPDEARVLNHVEPGQSLALWPARQRVLARILL